MCFFQGDLQIFSSQIRHVRHRFRHVLNTHGDYVAILVCCFLNLRHSAVFYHYVIGTLFICSLYLHFYDDLRIKLYFGKFKLSTEVPF